MILLYPVDKSLLYLKACVFFEVNPLENKKVPCSECFSDIQFLTAIHLQLTNPLLL
jgi:hypothetical protein